MRKLQHRNIKSFAQSCRAWERQELNASSRSTLSVIMHPASLGLRPTEKELVLPGPWTPYPAFSEVRLPQPSPRAIVLMPSAEIWPSQLPPCAMIPLNEAFLFLQTLLAGPMGTYGCPTCHVQSMVTRTHQQLTLLDAHLRLWCTILDLQSSIFKDSPN